MKKFKELNFTYNRLVNEVDMLTSKSIELNSEYNTINTKVKETKEEYENIKQEIKEYIFTNKSDVINFNKNYKDNLDKKDKKLIDLENKLKDKDNNLKALDLKLEKKLLWLTTTEEKLNTLDKQLIAKWKGLAKKVKAFKNERDILIDKQSAWVNCRKERKEEIKELDEYIIWIREEEKESKEKYDLRIQEINQQKNMLEEWERRLENKEEKITSEMRVLLSAKKYNNV